MYRRFTCIIYIFLLLPVSLLADAASQLSAIERIVQTQDEWKSNVVKSQHSFGTLNSTRIVGGSTVSRAAHPEFALILFTDSLGNVVNFCGGTLISPNKVLTAAHCTYGRSNSRTFVVPQYYSDNDTVLQSDIFRVSDRDTHPGYINSRYDYDVSVLTLSRNSATPTAKLFAADSTLENFQATIIGVGSLSEGGPLPTTLLGTNVPIVSNATCRNSYGATITERMLCAGFISGGRDSCQGDSGGPLWVNYEGEKVQAGITSFGQGCARPNFYGVYARTSALSAFIEQYAPEAEFLTEVPNIVPMLSALLLNDEIYEPPVCNQDISVGEPIDAQFSTPCYDFTESLYFKTFTFTLDSSNQVSINYPESSDVRSRVRLYDGSIQNGSIVDDELAYFDDVTLLNVLTAGTYTIEVISSVVDAALDLDVRFNDCPVMPVSLNVGKQNGFSEDCRSILDADHSYAHYYSFTLDQPQTILLSSEVSSNAAIELRLFSGTDVTVTPIDYDRGPYHGSALILNQLNAGSYTIEVSSTDLQAIPVTVVGDNDCVVNPISMSTNVQQGFTEQCRSIFDDQHPYAHYYTFTLDQSNSITLQSSLSLTSELELRLFSGTDVSIPPLDADRKYFGDHAVLLNDLAAGVYTVEVTSTDLLATADTVFSVNDCPALPMNLNTTADRGFTEQCRSMLGADHPYAHYYTFTLDQIQSIALRSKSLSSSRTDLRLFSGVDVSAPSIDHDRSYSGEEVILINNLAAGIYTLEVSSSDLLSTVQTDLNINDCPVRLIKISDNLKRDFTEHCRSLLDSNHSYALHYTFELDQAQTIAMRTTLSSNSILNLLLVSGDDVSDKTYDYSSSHTGGEVILLNNLAAGVYTVEISTDDLQASTETVLSINDCTALPVSLNTSTEQGFVEQCRSVSRHTHPYAHYYTFTLTQDQLITIRSPLSSDAQAYLQLFSGTDVSEWALDSDSMRDRDAVITRNLNAGTYTIEVTSSNLAAITGVTINTGI